MDRHGSTEGPAPVVYIQRLHDPIRSLVLSANPKLESTVPSAQVTLPEHQMPFWGLWVLGLWLQVTGFRLW